LEHENIFISDDKWTLLEIIRDFLEVFHDATLFFSGVYYPTSNQALAHFYEISLTFKKYRDFQIFQHMCLQMEEKFSQYWMVAPLTFCIAAVLDPRLKLQGVETLLNEINSNMNTTNINDITKIKADLEVLVVEYATRLGRSIAPIVPTGPPQVHKGKKKVIWSIMKKSHTPNSSSSGGLYNLTELTMYLGSDPITIDDEDEDDFDILAWWKSYENKFPVLSAIARDILTIPASTVASEQAFSASGRLIDPRRTMLKQDIVETCMCLRDWYAAEDREQHIETDVIEVEDELAELDIS